MGMLEASLIRLTVQHENMLHVAEEIREELRDQRDVSNDYREKFLNSLQATEREIERVKRDVEELKSRGAINWIRKNYMIITFAIAVMTALLALGRWLMAHLKF